MFTDQKDANNKVPENVNYQPPKAVPKYQEEKPRDASQWKKVNHNVNQPDNA